MKWSETYIPTLREFPAEAELISHKLLTKAGYIRKLTSGIYNYLPLMQLVLLKITNIVREEMNRSGAQEILMPVLHPAELWQKSGRWEVYGKELMRMKDRHQRDLVLGGTHEEVITDLIKGELRSYRQLPINLYQIQTKFRDEIRPRFGLMRGREFMMKDAYTFDADEESFKVSYQKMVDAYFEIFKRCGLETKMVESDTGAMGGKDAHEFMVIVDTEGGENVIFYCDQCDYAANIDKATSLDLKNQKKDTPKKMEKVHTPNKKTIEEVTQFLGEPPEKLVKTLIYKADGNLVAALIRGDKEINEIKLKNALGCVELEMADFESIKKLTGAEVGFSGPVGLSGVKIIADEQVTELTNAVTGANQDDYHLVNVNPGKDFKMDQVVDIKSAEEGGVCPRCKKGKLVAARGIEVGNTFMLGTKYSKALGATFIDKDRKEKPFIMGSYGVGITRTAQAAVEKFHDEKGIIWPVSISPLHVSIIPVNVQNQTQREVAFEIYEGMRKNKMEVIIDDRDERAGVKFNDSDLIGLPLRITVGERTFKEKKVELSIRGKKERIFCSKEEAVKMSKNILDKLQDDISL
ncbi:MAG: prolyl-tRNA synthetase [candidate division Zixibacteria bacterium SM23_73_2]|nr:MAG: prolyl-tRNA synthetase [candidate division Zixibacteria bacterium SM23_73_2]